MSIHRSRIRTLQAIVAGVPCLHAHPGHRDIQSEFNEVYAVRKIRKAARRRILEVLHSTRALDTTLSAFVGHYRCLPAAGNTPDSLGGYLVALEQHRVPGLGQMPGLQRRHFQTSIVNVRNTYMHRAGAFPPSDRDVQLLLAEMNTCLAVVSRL
jgi:hypothetical protein